MERNDHGNLLLYRSIGVEELWQDDLQRMKAAGITVIRVAEFAWNKVEPEEAFLPLISGMNLWSYVNRKKCR